MEYLKFIDEPYSTIYTVVVSPDDLKLFSLIDLKYFFDKREKRISKNKYEAIDKALAELKTIILAQLTNGCSQFTSPVELDPEIKPLISSHKQATNPLGNYKIIFKGDYRALCFVFGQLTRDNGKKYHFNNSVREIAIFIHNYFEFETPYSISINCIIEALNGNFESNARSYSNVYDEDQVYSNSVVLNWVGNNTQLYYIFKYLHHTNKKMNEYCIGVSYKDIGEVLFSNVSFRKKGPADARAIENELKSLSLKNFSKLNKPNINFIFPLS